MNSMYMSLKFFFVIFCFLSCSLFQAQKTNKLEEYYEFALCNSPHIVILKKSKNGKEKGAVFTNFEKRSDGKKDKIISRKTKINPKVVKEIFEKLKESKIELINSTYDDDSLYALDGDYLEVRILKSNKIEKYSFEEIYPIGTKKETTPLRMKLQNWVTLISEKVELKEIFSNIKKKLKKGTYCYSGGSIYTNCLKIK